MADQEEKTEQPTGKRKSEARNNGQVPKSQELNSVAMLVTGFCLLYLYRHRLYDGLTSMMILVFQEATRFTFSPENVIFYCKVGLLWMLRLLAPILAILLVVGVAINILQTGFLMTLKPIMPKMSKLNPFSGLKSLFSFSKVFDLFKNLAKLSLIGWVAYQGIRDNMPIFLGLWDCSLGQTFEVLLITIFKVGMKIAILLIILGIIDFIYQRYKNNQKMKMTKHEVKEERKQMEGDPKVKARIRSIQMEMARRRMMGEVPKATVVITNPTFIAIALKYEMGVDKAPVVLAKGKRKIAEKIKEIARENNIPIVEDKPLARAMYDVIEVGEQIPQEYFTSVAEILAYVYRLKEKAA
ncbi:MAG: flagellar biosynthesis protein FlhB [Elusimicrobia bacterium RIFOXYB2_FULL_49_7]|nr:MAG: flagellar biosynthesis protein FlhB [Elusimicrobia bacterium RIFOXYB2_FULL_49_7]